jgi:hypothetical protein
MTSWRTENVTLPKTLDTHLDKLPLLARAVAIAPSNFHRPCLKRADLLRELIEKYGAGSSASHGILKCFDNQNLTVTNRK